MRLISFRTRSTAFTMAIVLIIAGCVFVAARPSETDPRIIVSRTQPVLSPATGFDPTAGIAEMLASQAFVVQVWLELLTPEREVTDRAGHLDGTGHFGVRVPTAPAAGDGECANPVVPESVARRESGCRFDAYNPTGCSGRGCVGYLQIDEGHFYVVSPWNSNVSGACVDLAAVKWEPWAQFECGARLGPGAWS